MAGNSYRKQTARSRTTNTPHNTQLNRLTLSLEALHVDLNDPGPSLGPSNSSGTACSITVRNKDSSLVLKIQPESSENQGNSRHHAKRGQHAAGRNRYQQVATQRPHLNRAAPGGQTIDTFRGQTQRHQQPAPIARTSRGPSKSYSTRPKTANELNCPTCKIPFGSLQIYQCGRGHGSCYACMKYGKPCGICRSEIIPMRNFAVEEYFSEKLGRCPHIIYGCNHTTKLAKIHEHVKECVFGPLKCPFHDCFYEMPLNELVSHSDVWHPGQRVKNIGSELKIIYPFNASQNVYLVQIGDLYFVFRVLVSTEDSRIYMRAQLIGSKVDASKWMYEIHVYNKNEYRRKFTSSDVCMSFADTESERQGKYCTLTCAYASTFVHNGVLTYKFFIKKSV